MNTRLDSASCSRFTHFPLVRIKYIYLLPNFFTLGNIFCGFYAIISAINGNYLQAAYMILIASFFDLFDGKIARATKSTSRFGIEFDSLADLVSFGVAPSLLLYQWALIPVGRMGWLAAFLFVACGALRLARFNALLDDVSSKADFVGLPIPCAAWLLASVVIFHWHWRGAAPPQPWLMVVLVYAAAILMVSNITYRSFETFGVRARNPFEMMVAATLALIIMASKPQVTFFILCVSYVALGLAEALPSVRIRRLFARWQPTVNKEDTTP